MSQPSTDKQSSEGLSKNDVALLLQDGSANSRVTVLDKIAKQYSTGSFKEKELIYAEQIFRLMMKDAEVKVRHALSERVKDNPDIPRDIVLHLARDVEEVAIPVLEVSEVLSDSDLIQIIESSPEVRKLLTIAERDQVSARVSDILVESAEPEVVKTLLDNDGADISEKTYGKIIEEYSNHDEIKSSMIDRASLPMSVVEKLVNHVSDSLAAKLESKYKIEKVGGIKKEARESITLDLLTYPQSDYDIEQAITQMMSYGRLTPTMILSALCRGYLGFFEISLARLANIPKVNARKLIHDKGRLGFRALYDNTQLPEGMFDAVRLVLRVVQDMENGDKVPGTTQYANELVNRILKGADGQEVENLPYVIALIRQAAGT